MSLAQNAHLSYDNNPTRVRVAVRAETLYEEILTKSTLMQALYFVSQAGFLFSAYGLETSEAQDRSLMRVGTWLLQLSKGYKVLDHIAATDAQLLTQLESLWKQAQEVRARHSARSVGQLEGAYSLYQRSSFNPPN